jgi:hypothetical protein
MQNFSTNRTARTVVPCTEGATYRAAEAMSLTAHLLQVGEAFTVLSVDGERCEIIIGERRSRRQRPLLVFVTESHHTIERD